MPRWCSHFINTCPTCEIVQRCNCTTRRKRRRTATNCALCRAPGEPTPNDLPAKVEVPLEPTRKMLMAGGRHIAISPATTARKVWNAMVVAASWRGK